MLLDTGTEAEDPTKSKFKDRSPHPEIRHRDQGIPKIWSSQARSTKKQQSVFRSGVQLEVVTHERLINVPHF